MAVAVDERNQEGIGRVLVVDDLAEVRRAHSRVLKAAGYGVELAKSAQEAIAMVSTRTFDVVLSDVHMPDANGVHLLRKLRELDPELSVVLVSGAPDLPTALEAVQLERADGARGEAEHAGPGLFLSRLAPLRRPPHVPPRRSCHRQVELARPPLARLAQQRDI